jgi:hypothetical protein
MSGDVRSHNAHGIANRLRLLRPRDARAFLLVEGVDESKLYAHFVDRARCRIHIMHGWPNVLGALAILEAERFPGLLALVDADFNTLEGRAPPSRNAIFTDTHDLETMLLASPALDGVLIEYADEDKLAPLDGADGVRKRLLELGSPIGYLRWLNHKEGAWMRFDDLEMLDFIHEGTLEFDRGALMTTLRNRSKALVVVEAEVLRRAEALSEPGHDLWHVCCGHDLVRILSVALRKAFGENNDAEIKPARLEKELRLAFSLPHFQATRLWAAIAAWEGANAPYVILARGAP